LTAARILVVDDDPVILRLIEVNLDLEGFEVVTADRGEDAIAQARRGPFDLILLDLMMPEMSGWEIAESLQQDQATKGIPLVFLSARTQDEDRKRGEELGVAGYVTKPFDPADLVSTIRKLVKPE
jgi:DNA-binding response OmpR family regulator